MNPPLPSEISAFEPPSLSEFPVTFRGGGMDIFWNHTFQTGSVAYLREHIETVPQTFIPRV